jgi:hypothetical protein
VTKLEERTRRAWAIYRDSLRDLDGTAYDEEERRSWERLQRELEQLEESGAEVASGRPAQRSGLPHDPPVG